MAKRADRVGSIGLRVKTGHGSKRVIFKRINRVTDQTGRVKRVWPVLPCLLTSFSLTKLLPSSQTNLLPSSQLSLSQLSLTNLPKLPALSAPKLSLTNLPQALSHKVLLSTVLSLSKKKSSSALQRFRAKSLKGSALPSPNLWPKLLNWWSMRWICARKWEI